MLKDVFIFVFLPNDVQEALEVQNKASILSPDASKSNK